MKVSKCQSFPKAVHFKKNSNLNVLYRGAYSGFCQTSVINFSTKTEHVFEASGFSNNFRGISMTMICIYKESVLF